MKKVKCHFCKTIVGTEIPSNLKPFIKNHLKTNENYGGWIHILGKGDYIACKNCKDKEII